MSFPLPVGNEAIGLTEKHKLGCWGRSSLRTKIYSAKTGFSFGKPGTSLEGQILPIRTLSSYKRRLYQPQENTNVRDLCTEVKTQKSAMEKNYSFSKDVGRESRTPLEACPSQVRQEFLPLINLEPRSC